MARSCGVSKCQHVCASHPRGTHKPLHTHGKLDLVMTLSSDQAEMKEAELKNSGEAERSGVSIRTALENLDFSLRNYGDSLPGHCSEIKVED